MKNKEFLNQFSAINESVKLSDDKLEQIEGGKCAETCKKACSQSGKSGRSLLK